MPVYYTPNHGFTAYDEWKQSCQGTLHVAVFFQSIVYAMIKITKRDTTYHFMSVLPSSQIRNTQGVKISCKK